MGHPFGLQMERTIQLKGTYSTVAVPDAVGGVALPVPLKNEFNQVSYHFLEYPRPFQVLYSTPNVRRECTAAYSILEGHRQ